MQKREFIPAKGYLAVKINKCSRGFTLVEILVVMAILAMVAGIFMPAIVKMRLQSCQTININNQHQIVLTATGFATNNNGRYPESVATIGDENDWNWQEPTMMTAVRSRNPQLHRSMSSYLRSYVEDARTMFCPSAPHRYKYLQAAWDAGDEWYIPETP